MKHPEALIKAVADTLSDVWSRGQELRADAINILDALRAAEAEAMKTDRQELVAVIDDALGCDCTTDVVAVTDAILAEFHVSRREDETEPLRPEVKTHEATLRQPTLTQRQAEAIEKLRTLMASGKPIYVDGEPFVVEGLGPLRPPGADNAELSLVEYDGALFVCPKCTEHEWGTGNPGAPAEEWIRICHGCGYEWKIAEDWRHFARCEPFKSKAEYDAES